MEIKTPEQLGKELKNNPQKLIIVGELVSSVMTIREPSRTVWWGITGAIVALMISAKALPVAFGMGVAGPFALAIGGGSGALVIGVLGYNGTVTAVKIGKAGGGIEVLNRLREYKKVSYENKFDSKDDRLILEK